MTKVYYAHPMSWYGTKAETEDLEVLSAQFDEVLNPNQPSFDRQVKELYRQGQGHRVMEPFMKAVRSCDALAFRPFYGGKIGAGVAREALEALLWDKPVYRFGRGMMGISVLYPVMIGDFDLASNVLSIEETRARIRKGL